ncbi:DUF602-domain-containing protein [Macrolepiota fuliginosa MF-IS2]|uniref:DUF602-domain-containing protein n=1 Tax=Macrolepiota fuliginosa MF-IS2 TaxID=1400762 RepID=A0A9P5X654_9AGAR|nr:DUF602-domain-containing protein [Macrolepiota fuliginosa MF-IS2]
MGNDGGSIPDRRDLVKTKRKAEQADKANQTRARWFFCALSKRKLQEPVVACALGKLYNKDSIIEYLLDKSAYGDGEIICGHIKSLKDVKQLTLSPNTTPKADSKGAADDSTDRAQFVCPFTMKEMNGSQPFVYIWTCGCVFSLAGYKTMSGSSSGSPKVSEGEGLDLCPQCQKKYSGVDDIISLNPTSDEEERLREKMDHRKLLQAPKKSKKRKNGSSEEEPPKKKRETAAQPTINSTVATSKAVVSELAMEEAKRKATMSDALKSLYGEGQPKKKETFMTMGTFTRYA